MGEKGRRRKGTEEKVEDFITHPARMEGKEPGPKEKSLGDRIRIAREMHRLTIPELSRRTGIDEDTLRHVESNSMIPPLGELVKLGKALETSMSYFIAPGTDKHVTLVRADQRRETLRHAGKRIESYGYFYESLAPEKADRSMEPFMITLTPSEGARLSTHDGQEFLFILEGHVMVEVGGHKEHLQPGDAIYYDSTEPHLVRSVGGKEAKMLAVLYPGR